MMCILTSLEWSQSELRKVMGLLMRRRLARLCSLENHNLLSTWGSKFSFGDTTLTPPLNSPMYCLVSWRSILYLGRMICHRVLENPGAKHIVPFSAGYSSCYFAIVEMPRSVQRRLRRIYVTNMCYLLKFNVKGRRQDVPRKHSVTSEF